MRICSSHNSFAHLDRGWGENLLNDFFRMVFCSAFSEICAAQFCIFTD